jgi:tetratricopeptide (TPR) repeat protein
LQHVLVPEPEYMFKHALTLDVAYGSQLAEPRARLHAAVAQAIEGSGDRLDEQAGLLARHWESASEPVTASRWHMRAARWAGLTRGGEALRHARSILRLVEDLEATPESQRLEAQALGMLLSFGMRAEGGEFSDGPMLAERARRLADSSSDPTLRAGLESNLGSALLFSASVAEASTQFRKAILTADASGDLDLRSTNRFNAGVSSWFGGGLRDAAHSMREGLEILAAEPGFRSNTLGYDTEMALLSFLGLVEVQLGDVRQGVATLDRAIELSREMDPSTRVLALSWSSWAAVYDGDGKKSISRARRALELSEQVSAMNIRGMALMAMGRAHAANADWNEAVAFLQRVRTENPVYMRNFNGLGPALLALGEADAALSASEDLVARYDRFGMELWGSEAGLDLAEVLIARPSPPRERIEQQLEKATRFIERREFRILAPRVHQLRAALDPSAREAELREAHRLCSEMGSADAERLAALARHLE